jgi:hypothetical protein
VTINDDQWSELQRVRGEIVRTRRDLEASLERFDRLLAEMDLLASRAVMSE